MAKKRILTIDDEIDFSKLVKRNLELIGDFEVFIAGDGREGINLAKELKPDLILLDIMMPVLDGFGVLEELKKNIDTLTVPVIMLTARGDETSRLRARQLCGDDFITKPIEALDLKAKIEEIFKKRGMQ